MTAFRRRELLGGAFLRRLAAQRVASRPATGNATRPAPVARVGAPARRARVLPLLRPPGAIAEERFLERCTRCGDCLSACPTGALRPLPPARGPRAGTPVLDFEHGPCVLCADRPCAAACTPRALDPLLPADMGRARIDPLSCLAAAGSPCSICAERCPIEGALTLDRTGPPQVSPALCTGCGVCQHVCPAPQNAVMILPVAQRPEPREERIA